MPTAADFAAEPVVSVRDDLGGRLALMRSLYEAEPGPPVRAEEPGLVSWPTAGQFPAPLDPAGRWSLSAGDKTVNFKNATGAVTRDGSRSPRRSTRW